jgi:hypothetical protein
MTLAPQFPADADAEAEEVHEGPPFPCRNVTCCYDTSEHDTLCPACRDEMFGDEREARADELTETLRDIAGGF